MSLPIFQLIPDSNGYNVDGGSEVESVQLKGGAGRYRRDQLGASDMVSVQFTCDALRYQYARAFYRKTVQMGSLPFQARMIFDSPDLQDYNCYFADKTGFKLIKQQGMSYIIGATFEATPVTAADPVVDDSVVMLYGIYGDTLLDMFGSLDNLVNSLLV